MLSLITTFGVILIIYIISTLNDFDYKRIINKFCKKKKNSRQIIFQ